MAKSKMNSPIPIPETYQLETNTVWSFPDRGDWATHDGSYRGNWSPHIPRNLITRYSKPGDLVLDQFAGSGTTLVEASLLGRNSIGVDINPAALEISRERTTLGPEATGAIQLMLGDAADLSVLESGSIDLIVSHPPYANIIKYSEDIDGDLSLLTPPKFLDRMNSVAAESHRLLKPGGYCAILMGDMRKHGHVIPLGFQVMTQYLNAGFVLKEIVIKEQHNCTSTGYWRSQSLKYNFLLLAHEYLFIFHT